MNPMKGAIQLRNCNCNGNDNGRRRHRCGCMKMARGCWENFPYYTGPCPNADGCYGWRRCRWDDDACDNDCDRDCERDCDHGCDRDDDCRPRRRRRCRGKGPCCGMFVAYLPVAVGPNGTIPLVFNNPCKDGNFEVNSGMVRVERAGTYLATYTVRVPPATALDTTVTLNMDNASQASAITQVTTTAGDATSAYTAQAVFQADEGDTVSLRTSEAINVTETAAQPLFTLSLTKLDE